ncbi:MAG: GNAT family N-acetyltransferase [Candidatus Rokubacteria bacterium]|nr:GNAT family N-acetyltransferase [Candidatus Rokubacteria bacterium]
MPGAILGTRRLRLRPFTAEDAEAHARLYADPEVTRYLGGASAIAQTPGERSARTLEAFVRHWAEHGFGVWAVLERESGRLIGQCGLKYLPVAPVTAPEVEILYALERRCWGRGLATEAAGAALRHGFVTLRLPRIVAVTRPQHRASLGVMGKLGMSCHGSVEVCGIRAVLYALSRETYLARRDARRPGPATPTARRASDPRSARGSG